jgi:hypothetical protein
LYKVKAKINVLQVHTVSSTLSSAPTTDRNYSIQRNVHLIEVKLLVINILILKGEFLDVADCPRRLLNPVAAKALDHIKVKLSHNTPMEALGGERMYSSYSFTTSALDGGEWSASRPCHALPPGK